MPQHNPRTLKFKPKIESIQIWTGLKAPECYRRFFPAACDTDWIAVVGPTAIGDFGRHLFVSGYRRGHNICSQPLSDGTWMYCGQIAEPSALEED